MWNSFFLENIHFAINLFAALVLFAMGWLYFDAWLLRKTLKDGLKVAGLFLIAGSFVLSSTLIESTVLSSSILGSGITGFLISAFGIPGYLLLATGILIDPLQSHPGQKSVKKQALEAGLLLPFATVSIFKLLPFSLPIFATMVAFLYLRRATIGLEDHLKMVAVGFYILAFYELVGVSSILQNTSNVDLYKIVAPFGLVWIFKHIVLILAAGVLGRWVYFYLLKRLQSQIFMILTASILIIFLLITTTFTGLLLKNLEDETLKTLETDVKVLNYAVESKKGENLSDAESLARDTEVIAAVEKDDADGRKTLSDISQSILLTKKKNTLVIISSTGAVLARGEDKERVGDSISDDSLIKRLLLGESNSTVVTKDGVLGPEVSIRSGAPIKSGEKIIGAVMIGTTIDNAFVDGIKSATGLEAAIYGDNILSATTLLAADGKSRYIGIKEETSQIKEKVLQKAESYTGPVNLLNTPYFAAYLPLKDVDTNPVGMLFVGKRQIGVLQAAGRSIEATFIVAVILLILSIIPAYLVSRYLTNQIR